MKNLTALAKNICVLHLSDGDYGQIRRVLLALENSINELNYYIAFNVMSMEMTIPANYVIDMPDNTLDVIKCGIYCDGQIHLMGENESIRRMCTCSDSNKCAAHTFNNFAEGGLLGERYGVPSNQYPNGYYRYDRQTKQIVFGSGTDIYDGSVIVVEFHVSAGPEMIAMVPDEYVSLITYHALSILHMSTDPVLYQQYRREMIRSADMIKRKRQPSLSDMVSVLRANSYPGKI